MSAHAEQQQAWEALEWLWHQSNCPTLAVSGTRVPSCLESGQDPMGSSTRGAVLLLHNLFSTAVIAQVHGQV